MTKHDVAEAEGRLAELIDRARQGEAVVITRDDKPVAEIRAVAESSDDPASGTAMIEVLNRLAARRAARRPALIDAGLLVSGMRDAEER